MHYLDYNATAPARPQVLEVVREYQGLPLNASSIHANGRKAKAIISHSRKILAEIIGVFPSEIIFTGSGTEANNWVLRALHAMPVFVSAIEHASILKTARYLGNYTIIPVTALGIVDMDALAQMLTHQVPPFLVSVMLANNETGIIQPIRDIAKLVHEKGGLLHTDAVQAMGKIALDVNTLECDMMTVAAHKMGGIIGAASLIVKNTIMLHPLFIGGGQEANQRAGTENVTAIAAFAKAAQLIDIHFMQQLRGWLDAIEVETVIGKDSARLPNTQCIIMPNVPAEIQLMHFDLDNIAVSSGSACSSGKVEPSHVLKAMGMEEKEITNAIRVSGGWGTKHEDIKAFAESWKKLYKRKNTLI